MKNFVKSFTGGVLSCLTTPKAARFFGEPFFRLMGMRGEDREFELAEVKKVLVVRIDGIGDVVLFTPFLRELRSNMPDAWITLIVTPSAYNLVELCPYVNEVLTFGWITSGQHVELRLHKQALKLAWNHLWHRRFDLAINPRWDADYFHASFVAYFSGAPWRVGYSENVTEHKKQANRGYDSLLTHLVDDDNTLKHEVELNLDVIRFLGGEVQEDKLELWVGKEDDDFAEGVFKKHSLKPGELVIGLGPSGGRSSLKQWPLNGFIELGHWLKATYNARLLVVGGPGEEDLVSGIENEIEGNVINVVGKTTLRQMAALLKYCRLYVGNDTSPLHIAAAMGVPVVAIFGSSCHHRFGPWGDGQKVLFKQLQCGPCSGMPHIDRCSQCIFDTPHCIAGITVEEVKEAIRTQLRVGKKVEG